MTDNLKILFISHDASRTGAPILLMQLMRWLRDRGGVELELLLREPGELLDKFETCAPLCLYDLRSKHPVKWLLQACKESLKKWLFKGRGRPRLNTRQLLNRYREYSPDLIYSNTIVNGDLLEGLSELRCPVVTHVHELESVIQIRGERNWKAVDRHSVHFVVASAAVRENLVSNRSVDPSRITVIHEYVDYERIRSLSSDRLAMLERLEIPADSFVVCGSGLVQERKGTDLFVDLAEKLSAEPNGRLPYFIWVGGFVTRADRSAYEALAVDFIPRGHLIFTDQVDNPMDYFNACDVFALTSREDPFPIVCLEAASLGKPILCFEGAGGMHEFVEDDAGFTVPFLDTGEMAARIMDLVERPALKRQLGNRAREKVRENFDIRPAGSKILRIIQQTAQGRVP